MSDAFFKIGVYVYYFGKWPEWIDLYFETLRRNPTIDFHIFTDCEIPDLDAPNIFFHSISFDDYLKFARVKLEVEINALNGVKLCDLRPFLGFIHQDIFCKYDFYGYADSDLLFGDIRSFYTSDILKKYDVISSHKNRISGHFALFRNTRRNRLIFRKIYNWKKALKNPDFVGIDEHGITHAYQMTIFDKFNEKFSLRINNFFTRWASERRKKRLYMVEQFTTPFISIPWLDGSINSQQPDEWYYKDGKITNIRDGERNFLYIHFMNFKSSQWRHDGTKAPWEGKGKICFATPEEMTKGIIINSEGISPI